MIKIYENKKINRSERNLFIPTMNRQDMIKNQRKKSASVQRVEHELHQINKKLTSEIKNRRTDEVAKKGGLLFGSAIKKKEGR